MRVPNPLRTKRAASKRARQEYNPAMVKQILEADAAVPTTRACVDCHFHVSEVHKNSCGCPKIWHRCTYLSVKPTQHRVTGILQKVRTYGCFNMRLGLEYGFCGPDGRWFIPKEPVA